MASDHCIERRVAALGDQLETIQQRALPNRIGSDNDCQRPEISRKPIEQPVPIYLDTLDHIMPRFVRSAMQSFALPYYHNLATIYYTLFVPSCEVRFLSP
jgi:hypothetical protein